MKTLTVGLSATSFDAAAKWLDSYIASLQPKADEVVSDVAAFGASYARSVCQDPGIRVDDEVSQGGRSVVARGYTKADGKGKSWYYSPAFCEFGTGAAHKGSYPYDLPSGYVHGEGSPGHERAHAGDDWYYWGPGGKSARTSGDPAHPFMAPAANAMRDQVAAFAREVFA